MVLQKSDFVIAATELRTIDNLEFFQTGQCSKAVHHACTWLIAMPTVMFIVNCVPISNNVML